MLITTTKQLLLLLLLLLHVFNRYHNLNFTKVTLTGFSTFTYRKIVNRRESLELFAKYIAYISNRLPPVVGVLLDTFSKQTLIVLRS